MTRSAQHNLESGNTRQFSDSEHSSLSGSGLDLLKDGRQLNFTAGGSADKHLSSVAFDVGATETQQLTKEPSGHVGDGKFNPGRPFSQNEIALKIFDRVDSDQNGYLSKSELATAEADETYDMVEHYTIANLHENVDSIQVLKNDEWGWENDGITRGDLREREVRSRSAATAATSSESWADTRFWMFDTDRNRKLSRTEIMAGLYNPEANRQDKEMLTYLKNNFDKVEGAKPEPRFGAREISRDDVRAQQKPPLKTWDDVVAALKKQQ